jgi:hypothetical protein
VSSRDVLLTILGIVVAAIPLACSAGAMLDAARRPAWAWALAGKDRTAWVAMTGFGVLFCVTGVVTAPLYWFWVRPRVAAAEKGEITVLPELSGEERPSSRWHRPPRRARRASGR